MMHVYTTTMHCRSALCRNRSAARRSGPGAMMAVILLTDNDVYTVAEQAQTGVVLLVVLLLTYILLLFSDAILRIIGRQGAAILCVSWGSIFAHSRWKSS
jgi:MarC family integral membrane protein